MSRSRRRWKRWASSIRSMLRGRGNETQFHRGSYADSSRSLSTMLLERSCVVCVGRSVESDGGAVDSGGGSICRGGRSVERGGGSRRGRVEGGRGGGGKRGERGDRGGGGGGRGGGR